MAIRIPWDEQETAILIEACIAVNEGNKTKKEAIKEVSETLRKRAIDKGLTIDEMFRNENGITMQFMLINELLTQEKCGLRGASKIFIRMVELYRHERSKYDEILKEARKVSVSTKDIQDMFSKWLSEHLSPAQMSEIYITYYDIDSYLQREGILSSSLLDTVDLDKIASIKKMIATNGKFRFIHRNKIDKYAKAVGYYYTWLSEKQNRIQPLSAASERIQTSVSSDVKEEQQKKFVERTAETEENDNEVKFVCFGEGNSYAFTQVEYFEYFGTRQYNVKSWKKLYTDVLRCLVEDYPMEIRNLKGKSIGEGTRIDIGSWEQSLKMNSPRMFETDMYVETNLNATNILDKIKHLLDLCRVDSENLVIAYSFKKEANIEEDVSKTDEHKAEEMIQKKAESIVDEATEIAEKRKLFSEWLSSKGKDQGTILVSLMDISKMNKMALNKGITDKNIYFVENPSALKIISGRLQRCSSFLEIDIRLQKQYKKTLENFIEFRVAQMEEKDNDITVIRDVKPALQVNQNVELSDEEKNLSIILQEDYENGFHRSRTYRYLHIALRHAKESKTHHYVRKR